MCKSNIHYQVKKCLTCHVTDEKMQANIYDTNIRTVLTGMLKRLSSSIEEYKEKILNGIDVDSTQDIPFGILYKRLLDQFGTENIVSLILHLDGIALTKSTGLKLWLFTGSFVELPSILRYRRHNMILLSIWIGYIESNPDLWLKPIINELHSIKRQGDCPALAKILNFTGHSGYNCCFPCYIHGEHIINKRQYKYQSSLVLRRSHSYLQQSLMAHDKKTSILGHKGFSVLHTILDVPLPESVLIIYMHVSLLGHAKACILSLYQHLKPPERIELDQKISQQQLPHYFNRKMRCIKIFANVKANEIKNIILYGFLPHFQLYLSIERLSHIALYICFLRLLHTALILGSSTTIVAEELFKLFYHDHDDYFNGLQNLVLHLHEHMITIYKYYGSLSNIGCFGQEDLIGKIGSNHHGSRYHGELITFYYHIDYSLHDKPTTCLKINNEPYDLVLDSIVKNDVVHKQLCDCKQVNDCFNIYRRFIINKQMYHSLLYNKRGRSLSYFVQYFTDQMCTKFGTIEFFLTIRSQNLKFFLFGTLMENTHHRSERLKKPKKIFSPSDPIQPPYYLVSYGYPTKYRIIGRTSIQKITNDKAIINNVNGEVQLITSDNENDNETNDDDAYDNNDHSSHNSLSTSVLKRPSDGFRTPTLKRSNKIVDHQNRARNSSLERNQTTESSIHISHNYNDTITTHHSRQENILAGDTTTGRVLQSTNDHSNENIDNMDISFDDSNFKHQMITGMHLVQQNISKLTKKVVSLSVSPSSKYENLDAYRSKNDSENFPSEVIWNNTNLLDIIGRDPGDYGRQLLRHLFTEAELKSSLLPSQSAHLYQKDVLDSVRFGMLNEAIRVKFKLSHDGYRRYYTNSLRVKLSRFLYDSGTRKEKKETISKQTHSYQRTTGKQTATTNGIPEDLNFIVMNTQNFDTDSDQFDMEHQN
ncbi:unnamed protein product [Adineta steineri]|uniref:Uncharacterized protein n=1 Tax=Adineta steineri TaxID=433720 RepID=A0A819S5Q5_9BILA|nr:unnamed protein product [Adineta steineri]CAF4058885.1 unnamed protein product [Adineta steineri]